MQSNIQEIQTFGDVRRLILQTIIQVRDNEIGVQQGMAIAACMKTLNDNIQCEINAAKLSIATENSAHSFGRVVTMGRRLIGNTALQNPNLLEGDTNA